MRRCHRRFVATNHNPHTPTEYAMHAIDTTTNRQTPKVDTVFTTVDTPTQASAIDPIEAAFGDTHKVSQVKGLVPQGLIPLDPFAFDVVVAQ